MKSKISPWKDFKGNEIFEGSVIVHPSGEAGTVKYNQENATDHDKWLVDYGSQPYSRLCLQIGDKGKAEVLAY